MSLPREILDQLLSGYLDDVLSADERARFERLLRDDPDVARELQEVRELSGSLRAISQADRQQVKLEAGFADRVLDLAVARATAEGLGEDHPLVQLAAQPSAGAEPKKSTISWRVVGGILALAASLVIAFVAFRDRGEPVGPELPVNPELVAQLPKVDPIEKPEQPIHEPSPNEERIAVDQPATDQDARPEMVATSDVPAGTDVKQPAVDDVPRPAPDAVVVGTPTPKGPSSATVNGNRNGAKLVKIPYVMVFDVRRTEGGRESGAVVTAMRAASIDPANEKQITDDVVASISNPDTDLADDPVTVIYLEAPAKDVDLFYLNLVSDDEGIESVGMTLAIDPPLLSVVESIQLDDPTQVRHSMAWQLQSDSPQVINKLAQSLGDLEFLVLAAKKGTTPPPMQGSGANVIVPVMVLVR